MRPKPIPLPVPAKILTMYEETKDGCWQWSGSRGRDGYGTYHLNGENFRAHRVVFAALAMDPGTKTLHHECENTGCVNPRHLRMMSNSEHARLHHPPEELCGNCGSPKEMHRKYPACLLCERKRTRLYRQRNGDRIRAQARKRWAEDPEFRDRVYAARNRWRRRKSALAKEAK